MRVWFAQWGLGLPGDRGSVHGSSYHVESALYAAAWQRYASLWRKREFDGLWLRGQCQPVQYAAVASQIVQVEGVQAWSTGGCSRWTKSRGSWIVRKRRKTGGFNWLACRCHRLRAGGYLQLARRSRRYDLSNGICTPCGCADRNDRTVCPRGETGAGSGRAHERASDFQVFQGRELAEICRAVWLENYQWLQPQGHVYGYDPADGYELFL